MPFGDRLPLAVDELLQGLVPRGTQQVDPQRLTQQFLIQHLDLGAERVEARLLDPALSFQCHRIRVGGGLQLELRGDILLLCRRLGESLPDHCRPGCLRVQTRVETGTPGIHRGEIGLFFQQHLLDLA
ncbi:MAG: hypothetical protein WBG92_05655 [Thiohalocapsa sp.]